MSPLVTSVAPLRVVTTPATIIITTSTATTSTTTNTAITTTNTVTDHLRLTLQKTEDRIRIHIHITAGQNRMTIRVKLACHISKVPTIGPARTPRTTADRCRGSAMHHS